MRTSVRIAAVLALVVASQAMAASSVSYVVELGGDPNVTSYEGGAYPLYTRGSASDYPAATATYALGDTINWSVVATVSGSHEGTLGDGYIPAGLANIVCSLELKDNGGTTVPLERIAGTANTPTSKGWYSVINDGDADGARGGFFGADPLANAAFTTVFNINGNMANGGRLFDTAGNGGPLMGKTDTTPSVDSFSYPSCTGLPALAEDCGGLLVGMGAGYSSFIPPYLGGPNTSGVGLVGTSDGCDGLGEKPLMEGQISTIDLDPGTYTLTVIPGAGTNIMPNIDGLICEDGADTFAEAPNGMGGSTITFVIEDPGTPLAVVSSVSRKTHGTVGDFDAPSGTWEPRFKGTSTIGPIKVVTQFNQDIQRVNGDNTDISVSSGTIGAITVVGDTLTVAMSNVTNKATFTIGYPGIAGTDSTTNTTTDTNCWQVMAGDASGSSTTLVVNTTDYIYVRVTIPLAIDSTNFRRDINYDGRCNTTDYIYIRAMISSSTLPATCP